MKVKRFLFLICCVAIVLAIVFIFLHKNTNDYFIFTATDESLMERGFGTQVETSFAVYYISDGIEDDATVYIRQYENIFAELARQQMPVGFHTFYLISPWDGNVDMRVKQRVFLSTLHQLHRS